jgi:hypothetical protein
MLKKKNVKMLYVLCFPQLRRILKCCSVDCTKKIEFMKKDPESGEFCHFRPLRKIPVSSLITRRGSKFELLVVLVTLQEWIHS